MTGRHARVALLGEDALQHLIAKHSTGDFHQDEVRSCHVSEKSSLAALTRPYCTKNNLSLVPVCTHGLNAEILHHGCSALWLAFGL